MAAAHGRDAEQVVEAWITGDHDTGGWRGSREEASGLDGYT